MDAASALRERGYQGAATVGHGNALAGQNLLEGFQLGGIASGPRRLVAQVAQRGVALAQRLGVALQRVAVGRIHLAQRIVQVAAAAGGRAGDDFHILRHKEHDVQQPGQIGAALAGPVYLDRLLQPHCAVGKALFLQDDLDLQDARAVRHLGPHAGVGQPHVLGLPPDDLAVEGRDGRRTGGEQVDSLQQAGLALGVRSVQEQRRLWKGQFQAGIVAKVGQAEVSDAHERILH